jgi:hypothetical protein
LVATVDLILTMCESHSVEPQGLTIDYQNGDDHGDVSEVSSRRL